MIRHMGGVRPCRHLPIMARIWPQMMAMCGKVQSIGRSGQRSAEEMLETHNWVRSDHNSGKARLLKVLLK